MLLCETKMKSLCGILLWASAVSATLNLKQVRPELAAKLLKTSPASDDESISKRQAAAPLFLNDNTKSEYSSLSWY